MIGECQFHSKSDSTIKPSNSIQCEFHSKTDSTIKPTNRIQCEFHPITHSTIKSTNRTQCHSIQRQIQPLNPQIGFKSIPFKDGTNHETLKYDSMSIPLNNRLNH